MPKTGRHFSEEHKRKLSLAWDYSKHITDTMKEKVSKALTGRKFSIESKMKMSKNHAKYWQDKHPSKEHKRKISESLKGRMPANIKLLQSKESRRKMALTRMGISHPHKGHKHSEQVKRKMSIVRKKYLNEHPVYVQNLIETLMKDRRPTSPEKIIINMNILSIWYCGNGQFWIPNNGKNLNPDFKIHGQKKIIEVFGDYWHKDENPQDKIDLYKQVGFECLVLWEHELKEKPRYCREAIKEFIFKETQKEE